MTLAGVDGQMTLRSWNPRRSDRSILLIHGATSSSRTWWRVAPLLARRGFHVVAVDLPAHGETRVGAVGPTARVMAERILDALAGHRLDTLLGHSLGSLVALELTGLDPAIAGKLVLDEPPGLATVRWSTAAAHLAAEQPAATRDPGSYALAMRRALPFWSATDCQIAAEDFAACDLPALAEVLRAITEGESHARAAAVRMPALVLLGPDEGGEYVFGGPYGSSIQGADREQLLASLPRHETLVLGRGHVLHRDAPEDWVEAVGAFVA